MQTYVEDIGFYLILRDILFFVLLFVGYGISFNDKNNDRFWLYASLAIVVYAVVAGLRYDRGVDYAQYATELMGEWHVEGFREPLYELFVRTVVFLNIPYWCVFVFFSGMIITSVMSVLRHFPKVAIFALPVFFIINEYAAENLIRQFAAIPLLLFAFSSYLSGKKVRTYILLACVPLIHLSGLAPVGVMILLFYFNPSRFFKTGLVPVFIYIGAIALTGSSLYDSVSSIVDSSSGAVDSSRFEGYAEDSDRWFTEEGSISYQNSVEKETSVVGLSIGYLLNILILFFGFKLTMTDKRWVVVYYFSFLSILLFQIGGDIELYMRFYRWFNAFIPIITGYLLMYFNMHIIVKLVFILLVSYQYLYQFITTMSAAGEKGAAFVWDII